MNDLLIGLIFIIHRKSTNFRKLFLNYERQNILYFREMKSEFGEDKTFF